MIFGEERIDDALGMILAHSLRLPDAMLKKGRVLTAADLALLKRSGINFVTGARLEENDIGEDAAAEAVAQALCGEGVTKNTAITGRCNLFAAGSGLLVIDRERLDQLNRVDEAVTVATVEPFSVVGERQMLVTVKIIPFAVDRRVLDTCLAFAQGGGPLVSVRPFRPHAVTLILSTLPGLRERVLDTAAAVTRARVEKLGGQWLGEIRCPHDVGSIERALGRALADGASMVLIAGASATVDRRDVVPAALVRAGGAIDHFGMPVDPGNLLMLGRLRGVPVVNLPGCGRSPKPNGLDWILRRLMAGVTPSPQNIMSMGAGGLLKDVAARPLIADPLGLTPLVPPGHRLAAVILAADGGAVLDGRPMTALAIETAVEAELDTVVVVANGASGPLEGTLPACEVRLVDNPQPERGSGHALALAIAALPDHVDGAIVMLAHMPHVLSHHLTRLVSAFDPEEGRAIIVPTHGGQRGSPVLFDRQFFAELSRLDGAQDGRHLLNEHRELVYDIAMDDDGVLITAP